MERGKVEGSLSVYHNMRAYIPPLARVCSPGCQDPAIAGVNNRGQKHTGPIAVRSTKGSWKTLAEIP
jgi:hypothetical protein